LAALYLTMVLTNWALPTSDDSDKNSSVQVDQGMMSVWVKIISAWATIVLYLWTLLAPILFPHRFETEM